jgi:DNA-binding transcriptional regulator GbsR (MarR family)
MKAETEKPSAATAEAVRREIVDFMVRLFRLMGLPKTIGSIYGYVYASPVPVSMDELTKALGISLGSASQGLRTLKVFRAVKPSFVPGERREMFEAETDFHRFVGMFLRGELEQYVENTGKRTGRMGEQVEGMPPGEDREFLRDRVERLRGMNERAKALIPVLEEIFATASPVFAQESDG